VRTFAVAALLLIAACKSAPETKPEAPPPDPRIFYPLAQGNSWTYAVRGSPETTRIEIIGQDGPWFIDDHRGRVRYDDLGVRDTDRYLIRSPVVAGAHWSAVENYVVQNFEIVNVDSTVTTQAGTFAHCVVVRTSTLVKKGITFVTEWTYAPRVGIAQIVTSTVDAKGKVEEQTHLTLTAYHVAK
jgi:hypothetical protein